jgi:hypothetical protein
VSTVPEPDVGLLAEYAEGLLDGTPEGTTVAHRIATDDRWAAAWAGLPEALAAVRRDLGALGPPGPVPPEVTTRLEATVRRLRPARRRWLVGAGLAAAAAAAGGIAVTGGLLATGGGPPQSSAADSLPTRIGTTVVTSTGTDYAAPLGTYGFEDPGPAAASPRASTPSGGSPAPVPLALSRLLDSAALRACLESLHAFSPGESALSADFARLGTAPAVVIAFTDGTRVAVGPRCGRGGPDVLALLGTPR